MFPPPGWKVNVFNRDFQAYNYDTTLVTLEKWESSSYSSYTYTPWSFRFPAQTSRDLPGPNFRRIEISPLFFLEKLQSTVPHAKVFVEVKNFWSWRSKITLHQLHQKKKFLEKKTPRYVHFRHVGLRQGSWQIFSLGHEDELDGEFSGRFI